MHGFEKSQAHAGGAQNQFLYPKASIGAHTENTSNDLIMQKEFKESWIVPFIFFILFQTKMAQSGQKQAKYSR